MACSPYCCCYYCWRCCFIADVPCFCCFVTDAGGGAVVELVGLLSLLFVGAVDIVILVVAVAVAIVIVVALSYISQIWVAQTIVLKTALLLYGLHHVS